MHACMQAGRRGTHLAEEDVLGHALDVVELPEERRLVQHVDRLLERRAEERALNDGEGGVNGVGDV